MNNTELEQSSIQCLFDYTKWQRELYKDKSVEELFSAASDRKAKNDSLEPKQS